MRQEIAVCDWCLRPLVVADPDDMHAAVENGTYLHVADTFYRRDRDDFTQVLHTALDFCDADCLRNHLVAKQIVATQIRFKK